MTASSPNVATNSLRSLRWPLTHVLRQREGGLVEHQVRGRDADQSARDLRDHVAGGVPPRNATLRGVGDRDDRVEVCARDGPNVKMSATSAAPVASVFARSATADVAVREALAHDARPDDGASNMAVPRAFGHEAPAERHVAEARLTGCEYMCESEYKTDDVRASE